jgi:hypothetical protein
MKIFRLGQIWESDSHTGMINKVLGTNYPAYMRFSVPLSKWGKEGIAWFAFMDGTVHGHRKDYLWTNTLSEDGKTICEQSASDNLDYAIEHTRVNGLFPKRLCFQLDPDGTGNRNKCKFVGYFELDTPIVNERMHKRTHQRVSEEFILP